jgi:diguanylate cyclase (GGDEF)-like protein
VQVWQQSWIGWLLALIAVGIAAVGVVALRRRTAPGASWLAGLCTAVAVWTLAAGLGTAAVPLALKVALAKTEFLAALAVGPCWLLLTRAFVRRPPLGRRLEGALWAFPVLCIPFVLSNWHGLVFSKVTVVSTSAGVEGRYDFGPLRWAVAILIYLSVVVGIAWLVRAARSASGAFRRQALTLMFAGLLPMMVDLVDELGYSPFKQDLDLAPLGFAVVAALLGWSLLRDRLLEIAPRARDTLLRTLPDGVLVVNQHDRLVEANAGACGLLGIDAEALGQPIQVVLDGWPELAKTCSEKAPSRSEIELELAGEDAGGRRLEVRVTMLSDEAGVPQGRLVTLHDMTQRARALSQLHDRTARLSALLSAGRVIAGTLDYEQVLQQIVRQGRLGLGAGTCLLYEFDEGERKLNLRARDDVLDEARPLWPAPDYRSAQHLIAGRNMAVGGDPVIWNAADDVARRAFPGELLDAVDGDLLLVPLVHRGRVLGELVSAKGHGGSAITSEERDFARGLGEEAALAMANARLYDEVNRLHLGNLRALSSALNAKDYYTLGHAGRVSAYMVLLGRELGWSEDRLSNIQDAAYLHDIGKIAVSDRVLTKPGPLSSEEWELMRQHPAISAEIVAPIFDQELVAGVRHHHERFDGFGYPDGLAAQAIPLMAQAMCVADCYDAMSSDRPYRQGLSYDECLAELRGCAGAQFAPDLVPPFVDALERLQTRQHRAQALAGEAAMLIDPAKHALLRARADEARPEYEEMVKSLRGLRDANTPVRFVTSFALIDGQCAAVLDTGETEEELSHVGEPWFAAPMLERVLAGETLAANVLTADEFGVWVTGLAPVCDASGTVVAAVSVDLPAVESAGLQQFHTDLSPGLAAMLQSAAVRSSRAELEAMTDGLTGLYNHRYLHERMAEEVGRARHEKTKLSLLFCGLDGFKRYNEAHGYKTGDEALCRVARIIEGHSRQVDLAARFGGKEFALVLIEADSAGAAEVAERIRAEVAAAHADQEEPLTVSIGVATCPDDARTKDELLDKAAWAMHAAKRGGRNRVVVFSASLPRGDEPPPDGGQEDQAAAATSA